jgi:asparagine synthase (glutamine-hydrolysing)
MLTQYDVPTLYALKGEIVRRGVKAMTGFDMPVFPKRRFQHGAISVEAMRSRIGTDEATNRRTLYDLYA